MLIKRLFLFCTFIIAASSYDGHKVSDLEPEIREELMIILKDPFNLKGECDGTSKPAEVKFYLSTRKNPQGVEIPANKPEIIDRSKKIVFLVHGWLGNYKSRNIAALKDAYLKRYDCNVVIVDWNKTAWQRYTTSTCELPVAAQRVSNFLCLMSFRLDVPLSEIHVVGHSLGAHLTGVAGYNVMSKCKQTLGRITGLDPTAPMFFRIPEKERLDKTSALFVDVILTNSGFFGYYEAIGDVHFSPNCARQQPGCMSNREVNETTLVTDAMCDHLRSVDLMSDSVNSEDLIAVSCGLCPRRCQADIINEVYQVMGEDCRVQPKPARNFLIPTNAAPPYGQGWDPYQKAMEQNFNLLDSFLETLP